MFPANGPLEGPIPEEILLAHPPLKLALAQIKFSPILTINQPNSPQVAAFQEAVREEYPDYQADSPVSVALGPQGMQVSSSIHHRFKSGDGWEISLTQDFATLTTTRYRNKNDFAAKVGEMSKAVREHINPRQANRLGVRFIDRIEKKPLHQAGDYIAPAYWGALSDFGEQTQSMLTESILNLSEGETMIVRWGLIPANHQIPSTSIPPIETPCWILDSDIHAQKFESFNPEEIAECTEQLAGRIYAVFRAVFNDNFIRHCGGKV